MDLTTEVEKYKKAGANILLAPTATAPQTIFTPIIEEIKLSPDHRNDKDCYPDKGKLQLTSFALAKLAACAGVMWDTQETKRSDKGNNSDYVSYQAVGSVRRFDGSLDRQIGEYDIDMVVIADEVEMSQSAKSEEKTPLQIAHAIKKEVLFIRKHKLKKCETGAKSIVIRKLLAIKNGGYTAQELNNPFVIFRYVIVPDYNNPYIMRKLQDIALTAITGIYGGADNNQARLTHEPEQFDNGSVIDIPFDDSDSYTPPGEPIHPETGTAPKVPEAPKPDTESNGKSIKDQEIDFSNCDQAEQINILEALIKRKAYDTKTFPKPMAKFSETNRISLFRKLLTMPDAPTPVYDDSDIPF